MLRAAPLALALLGCHAATPSGNASPQQPQTAALMSAAPSAPACSAKCTRRTLPAHAVGRVLIGTDQIYFTEGHALSAQPREGGAKRTLLEGRIQRLFDAGPSLVVCQSASSGWDPGELSSVPKQGGKPTRLAGDALCDAVIVGDDLYFVRLVGPERALLMRVNTQGGPEAGLVAISAGSPEPEGANRATLATLELATDGRDVYWVLEDGIYRYAVAADTLQRISSIPDAERLTFLHGKLYCAARGKLIEISADGQNRVAANHQRMHALTSGGQFVYWVANGLVRFDPVRGTVAKLDTWPDYWPLSAAEDSVLFVARAEGSPSLTLIEDCACNPAALAESPAIRAAVPATEPAEFYVASDGDERSFAASDLSMDEYDQVQNLAERYGSAQRVVLRDPDVPARFAHGQPFLVHTAKGTFERRVTQLSLTWDPNESWQLWVALGVTPGPEPALVTRPGMAITFPAPLETPQDLSAKYLPAVQRAFAKENVPEPITREHVQVKLGRFPAPHTALIAVDVPDPSDRFQCYAALFIGDDQGSISQVLQAPARDYSRFNLDDAVDLYADGIDDVFISKGYYEGGSSNILVWRAGQPQWVALRAWGQ